MEKTNDNNKYTKNNRKKEKNKTNRQIIKKK